MNSFTYYCPTRIVFGRGAEDSAASETARLRSKRVLVVYGSDRIVRSGLLSKVVDALGGAGIEHRELGGVVPNPLLSFAREGVKSALDFGADLILAIGGGSAIDTAKAIAHGAANPETGIWEFWSGKSALTKTLPVGAVLTISAAGSETSNSAVLTNDDTLQKRGLTSDLNRPAFAVMDPELTFTTPDYQAACGICDIMMHTLERYINPETGNEFTDEAAAALLRTVMKNGRRYYDKRDDYDAASEVMWCGSVSHTGFTGLGGAQDFSVHQLAHELSALFNATHGAALTAMWGSYARYVCAENYSRFVKLGLSVFGGSVSGSTEKETALNTISAFESYFTSLKMPISLPELGVGLLPAEKLETLAYGCSRAKTRTIGTFKQLGYDDILKIYMSANR